MPRNLYPIFEQLHVTALSGDPPNGRRLVIKIVPSMGVRPNIVPSDDQRNTDLCDTIRE
jgi:hypothetical protein